MIPSLWRRPRIALAIATALLALLPALAGLLLARPASAAGDILDGLLGSIEIRVDSSPFTARWGGLRRRLARDLPVSRACAAGGPCADGLRAWRVLLAGTAARPRREQLVRINAGVNALIRYRGDAEAFGAADHWATPAQALARGGDCEDYAIAKMAALEQLGWPAESMRLVIVQEARRPARATGTQEERRDRAIIHAVLAVRHAGATWILDNRADAITTHEHRLRYVPLWSASGDAEWTHIVTPQIRARFVDRRMGGLS